MCICSYFWNITKIIYLQIFFSPLWYRNFQFDVTAVKQSSFTLLVSILISQPKWNACAEHRVKSLCPSLTYSQDRIGTFKTRLKGNPSSWTTPHLHMQALLLNKATWVYTLSFLTQHFYNYIICMLSSSSCRLCLHKCLVFIVFKCPSNCSKGLSILHQFSMLV